MCKQWQVRREPSEPPSNAQDCTIAHLGRCDACTLACHLLHPRSSVQQCTTRCGRAHAMWVAARRNVALQPSWPAWCWGWSWARAATSSSTASRYTTPPLLQWPPATADPATSRRAQPHATATTRSQLRQRPSKTCQRQTSPRSCATGSRACQRSTPYRQARMSSSRLAMVTTRLSCSMRQRSLRIWACLWWCWPSIQPPQTPAKSTACRSCGARCAWIRPTSGRIGAAPPCVRPLQCLALQRVPVAPHL